MPRSLHAAILRNAARLVPAPSRAEWLAEWNAELWYVEHDATSFCFGSFRDALWLRLRSFSARRAFSLDSPLRCVLFLASLAIVTLLLAAPPRSSWPSACSLSEAEQLAVGLFWMYLESLLVLLTLNPLSLGEYSANDCASSLLTRARRWAFLAIKIALLPPILFLLAVALVPMFPPAPALILPGLILGFRWALADQRQRCPVCLHLLSEPLHVGSPGRMLLDSYGTELVCPRGHGSFCVPEVPTSWSSSQRWQYRSPIDEPAFAERSL